MVPCQSTSEFRVCGLGSMCTAGSQNSGSGFGLLPTELVFDSICLVLIGYSTASRAVLRRVGHRWSVPSSRLPAILCRLRWFLALHCNPFIFFHLLALPRNVRLPPKTSSKDMNLTSISQNDAEKTSNDSFHTAQSTISCETPQPQPPRRRRQASKEKESGEGKKVGFIGCLPPKDTPHPLGCSLTCTNTYFRVCTKSEIYSFRDTACL